MKSSLLSLLIYFLLGLAFVEAATKEEIEDFFRYSPWETTSAFERQLESFRFSHLIQRHTGTDIISIAIKQKNENRKRVGTVNQNSEIDRLLKTIRRLVVLKKGTANDLLNVAFGYDGKLIDLALNRMSAPSDLSEAIKADLVMGAFRYALEKNLSDSAFKIVNAIVASEQLEEATKGNILFAAFRYASNQQQSHIANYILKNAVLSNGLNEETKSKLSSATFHYASEHGFNGLAIDIFNSRYFKVHFKDRLKQVGYLGTGRVLEHVLNKMPVDRQMIHLVFQHVKSPSTSPFDLIIILKSPYKRYMDDKGQNQVLIRLAEAIVHERLDISKLDDEEIKIAFNSLFTRRGEARLNRLPENADIHRFAIHIFKEAKRRTHFTEAFEPFFLEKIWTSRPDSIAGGKTLLYLLQNLPLEKVLEKVHIRQFHGGKNALICKVLVTWDQFMKAVISPKEKDSHEHSQSLLNEWMGTLVQLYGKDKIREKGMTLSQINTRRYALTSNQIDQVKYFLRQELERLHA